MEPPRFLCDEMFSGLARWLRAAGYDATCPRRMSESKLLSTAAEEGRILVTTNARLTERNDLRGARLRLLPVGLTNHEALARLADALKLTRQPSRCMVCGGALLDAPKELVKNEAPAATYAAFAQFFRCESCGKLYWRGSHWRRIVAALDRIIF